MTAGVPSDDVRQPQVVQNVYAFGGFAYGAINADVHIFGDGRPVYTLEEHHRPVGEPDLRWVQQPSRLLDARHAVVPFTGREEELRELEDWRERSSGPPLAVRWLHGPGGRGKTRLAAHLAEVSAAAGWKTIVVRHGGQVRPESQGSHDGRVSDQVGLLVLVDYADRWPLQHLDWLFANTLFAQRVPVRVLLLARTAHAWQPVQRMLNDRADTSERLLEAVPDNPGDREQVFMAAQSRFAQLYGLSDSPLLAPPGSLRHPDFGLTLALHMSALVTVDAHVTQRRSPEDVVGLSAYLLNREREHWTRLYENRQAGLDFQTGPKTMAKVVFTAALTGDTDHAAGTKVLEVAGIAGHPQTLIDDHRTCYPPVNPERVLEPLYPDRLAEDFLALLTPGHDLSGYPTDPWAAATATTLLAGPNQDGSYAPRAITFLAAAADRWPHVGQKILYPLLKEHPQLAVAAGSAALTTIAAIGSDANQIAPDLLNVLRAVNEQLPDERHVDLDVGIAAVARRLTAHHLTKISDQAMRGGLYTNLAGRLNNAGLYQEALSSGDKAVAIYRLLAADDSQYIPMLAMCLSNLGIALGELGHKERAAAAAVEAVALFGKSRTLSSSESEFNRSRYALALNNLSSDLAEQGRYGDAVGAARESVRIYRQLVEATPARFEHELARALSSLGVHLSTAGSKTEALTVTSEAVDLYRSLATKNPHAFEPDWATSLQSLGRCLSDMGQHTNAITADSKAVEVLRRQADANPVVFEPPLGRALNGLAIELATFGRKTQAVAASIEAVEIYRKHARINPKAFEHDLAQLLSTAGTRLVETGQGELAIAAIREAVDILRRLTIATPGAFESELAGILNDLSFAHGTLGQPGQAFAASSESVQRYGELARRMPAAFEPLLAKALLNKGVALMNLKRLPEALDTMRQVVDIRRRLVAANPAAYLPELARSLSNLGGIQSVLRSWRDALDSTSQSVEIWRKLAAADPPAFEPDLAQSIIPFTWVRIRRQVELAEAKEAILHAIAIYQRLTEQDPEAFSGHLQEVIQLRASIR